MRASELLERVRAAGGEILLNDAGQPVLRDPGAAVDAATRAALKAAKDEIAGILKAEAQPAPGAAEEDPIADLKRRIVGRMAALSAAAPTTTEPLGAMVSRLWPDLRAQIDAAEEAVNAAALACQSAQGREAFTAALLRFDAAWRDVFRRLERSCHECGAEAVALVEAKDGDRRCGRCLAGGAK